MIYLANNNGSYLRHHGILGMKWGHRKGNVVIGNQKKIEKQQFKRDYKNYRKNKGVYNVSKDEFGNISVDTTSRGDAILQNLRRNKGEQYANKILKKSKRRDRAYKLGALGSVAAVGVGASFLQKKFNLPTMYISAPLNLF